MHITVLGVGEASDPKESNSSVVVESGGHRVLIDCGHSIPPVLWRRFSDPDAIDTIVFTHHHPDHCFGLVPWMISLADGGRQKPLSIVTTGWGIGHLKQLCNLGMVPHGRSSPFPIHWDERNRNGKIGPFTVSRARTKHSIVNSAILLEADGALFGYSGDGQPTAESRNASSAAPTCYFTSATLSIPRGDPLSRRSCDRSRSRGSITHRYLPHP